MRREKLPTVEERVAGGEEGSEHSTTCGSFHYLGVVFARATSKVCRTDSGHPAEQNNHISRAAEPLAATLLTRSWLGTANLRARLLFAASDIIGVNTCLLKATTRYRPP